MNKKLLTISIAAYNVSEYIEYTLESLCVNEIIDELEIFVIDDGGTDDTVKIARKYQKKYPRSIYLIEKENGGYGSTVNYSLSHASGKYFKLLDGDDWFCKDNLINLIKFLKTHETDVIVTPYYRGASPDSLKIDKCNLKMNEELKIGEIEKPPVLGMWALIYKTEIIKKSQLHLPEHCLYTDQLYCVIPFSVARTIIHIDLPIYCYRIARNGQSISSESKIAHIDEIINLCVKECDYFVDNKLETNGNCNFLLTRISSYYVGALKTLFLLPKKLDNKKRIVEFERNANRKYREIYEYAVTQGKFGYVIKFLRLTNYRVYWLIKLLPRELFNGK